MAHHKDCSVDEALKCLQDDDCCNFVKSECSKHVPTNAASTVGAGADSILNLVFTLLPVVLDAIKRWRQSNPPAPVPTP